jgi:lipid II isoglutaminyl synthase (glutamine-hydrolysing)
MKRWFILTSAMVIVRLFYWLSRFLGLGEGSNIPGRIVAKIFPNVLRIIVPRFKHGWILITGTNGKTTTTKILTEVMRESGLKVVTNSRGANLLSGIITSLFLAKIQPAQMFMADYAVFEIDEAVLIKSFHLFQPNFLVVTNFSRDQLDRYGEVDSNVNRIMELVRNAGYPCKVILNGNDPNVARIGSAVDSGNRIYFGIKGETSSPETGLLIEKDTGKGLDAGLDLPNLDFWAEVIQGNYLEGSRFILGHQQRTMEVGIKLPGVFNILNALAATAVGSALNGDLEKISSCIGKVEPSYGRSELFRFGHFSVFLFLVKNPVGFNHIIQLLTQAYGEKRVLLLLNDLTADGTDVSWIWDIELENLWKVKGIHEIVTSGTRAGDMALRVKYSNSAGIPLTVDYSPKRAFRDLASRIKEGEELLVLANYTSMIKFRPFLLKNCRSQNILQKV